MKNFYDKSSVIPTIFINDTPITNMKISYGGDYEGITQLLGKFSNYKLLILKILI